MLQRNYFTTATKSMLSLFAAPAGHRAAQCLDYRPCISVSHEIDKAAPNSTSGCNYNVDGTGLNFLDCSYVQFTSFCEFFLSNAPSGLLTPVTLLFRPL
jgi:hypothetical protein